MAAQEIKDILSKIEIHEGNVKKMLDSPGARSIRSNIDATLGELEAYVGKIAQMNDAILKEWQQRIALLKERREVLDASGGTAQISKMSGTSFQVPGDNDEAVLDITTELKIKSSKPLKAPKPGQGGEGAPPEKLVKELEKLYKKVTKFFDKQEIPTAKIQAKMAKLIQTAAKIPKSCAVYAAQWQERIDALLIEYNPNLNNEDDAQVEPQLASMSAATNSMKDMHRYFNEEVENVKPSPEEKVKQLDKLDTPLPIPNASKPSVFEATVSVVSQPPISDDFDWGCGGELPISSSKPVVPPVSNAPPTHDDWGSGAGLSTSSSKSFVPPASPTGDDYDWGSGGDQPASSSFKNADGDFGQSSHAQYQQADDLYQPPAFAEEQHVGGYRDSQARSYDNQQHGGDYRDQQKQNVDVGSEHDHQDPEVARLCARLKNFYDKFNLNEREGEDVSYAREIRALLPLTMKARRMVEWLRDQQGHSCNILFGEIFEFAWNKLPSTLQANSNLNLEDKRLNEMIRFLERYLMEDADKVIAAKVPDELDLLWHCSFCKVDGHNNMKCPRIKAQFCSQCFKYNHTARRCPNDALPMEDFFPEARK